VFAPTRAALDAYLDAFRDAAPTKGLAIAQELVCEPNPRGREHFGFRDGLSQPVIAGLGGQGPAFNTVADGEFVLGYPNGYQQLPDSPLVPEALDPEGILPAVEQQPGLRDWGRNGSYLVFRQLKQQVSRFWEQIGDAVQREQGKTTPEACLQLGAKMVGRWPNGNPLTVQGDQQPGEEKPAAELNDFQYHDEDLAGFKCPWGSHIRRSNPRDAMPDNKQASSTRISNLHRILRRGRIYGPPLVPDMEPGAMLGLPDDGEDRGLLFLCFNTNISRQFEFIQHTWCNNSKFAGLYQDPDPVLGIRDERAEGPSQDFTMPAEPVRRKVQGLSRQVHTVGGAYFFMPGLRALRFLAHYQPQPD